jgi:mannose-6-phosphate isomerase-like protein (cupin superfamily)
MHGLPGFVLALSLLMPSVPAGAQQVPAPRLTTEEQGPKYEKYAEGLYTRRVFQAVSPTKDYSVEIWGLLVGPGRKTAAVTLPGAATLVVRSGRAVVMVGSSRRELELGGSLLVPEGQRFSITNPDAQRPISIRAVVIKGL